MNESKQHPKDYRVYTDVFIPDNTHIEVFYSYAMKPKKKKSMLIYDGDIDYNKVSGINIDFFNMTLILSIKKAKELQRKLQKKMELLK